MNPDEMHPTTEHLADHAEGLLAEDEAVRVAAHILECELCQDTVAVLTDVSALLAADDPGPMPADVAARLDAALAAEAVPAGEPGPVAAAAMATGPAPVSDLMARRRARAQRWAKYGSAAAAVVLVGAGSVLGLQAIRGGGSDQAAQAPFSAESAPGGALGTTAAPVEITVSGRDYTAAGFPDSVRALAAGPAAPASAYSREERGQRLDDTSAADSTELDRCVAAVASYAGSAVLAADLGEWQDAAALVVVVADPEAADRVIGYVVRPGCGSGPLTVLHQAGAPR